MDRHGERWKRYERPVHGAVPGKKDLEALDRIENPEARMEAALEAHFARAHANGDGWIGEHPVRRPVG